MSYSDEFIRQIGKRSNAGKIKIVSLRKLFFDFLKEVPEDLQWDIFNLFFPDTADDSELNASEAEKLTSVIDLFEGEYTDEELKLSNQELKFISEGVNDYAVELSDETLMNVMQAAVSRGLLN